MTLSSFLQSDRSKRPHYALFGHPVEHSFSPLMHNAALDYYNLDARYYAIDLRSNELSQLASYLNSDQLLGANVTIPYKQTIADYLDSIEPTAASIGAVNTVVKEGFRLKGVNTDIQGFATPLQAFGDRLEGRRAIIFGTGGASRAVVAALADWDMSELFVVSRNPHTVQEFQEKNGVEVIGYPEWTFFAEEAVLIVNTTPLGMHPNVEASPVKVVEQQYLADRICYDLVYNPVETTFLQQAKSAGAATIGGLEMLIQQGSRSFEHWTGQPFPINNIRDLVYEKLQN